MKKQYLLLIFFALLAGIAAGQERITLEYFFDKDEGFGKNKLAAVTLSNDTPIAFTADTKGLSAGTHALSFRLRNTKGHWSHTGRKLVEIAKNRQQQVVVLEYFAGPEPGIGQGRPHKIAAPFENGEYTFRIPREHLSEGNVTLFLRAQSIPGAYSLTRWRTGAIRFLNCQAPLISQSGAVLSATTGVAYQWHKENQALPHANGQTYQPVANGQYTVTVTTAEGCIETSAPFQFIITGTEPSGNGPALVYPNPFREELIVETAPGEALAVYTVAGQLVNRSENHSGNHRFNTSGWSAGIYVLKITGNNLKVTSRIVTRY